MKKIRIFIVLALFFSCQIFVFSLPQKPKPEWVTNWRKIYPNNIYIAQLGKAVGKKSANESKTVAANTIAQYIRTSIESQTESSAKYTTYATKKGTLTATTGKVNSQTINLSSDFSVTSLEFTEPWYNKKEKTWYCVAYITREKCWEQYRPDLQNARDKLFAFYEAAEKSSEPLYKMIIYAESTQYEDEYWYWYSMERTLSLPLTEQNYKNDSKYISSIGSKISEEKSNCTFAVNVKNDVQNIVYQSLKDELSSAGFSVKNSSEESLYTINANILVSETKVNSIHVAKPSIEITIDGKTNTLFSYAKQQNNVTALNEDVVNKKAVHSIADEIKSSFIKVFNEKNKLSVADANSKLSR